MPNYTYPIPLRTVRLLPRGECANPGLLFDRYVGYNADWSLKTSGDSDPRRAALTQVKQAQEEFGQNWTALRDGLLARWKAAAEAAGASEADKSIFRAAPVWRFVTGLGRNTPLEVGFTFDRVYGLPIIPGSGLKGLTRAATLWTLADALGVSLLRASAVETRHKNKEHTPVERLEAALLADQGKRQALLEKLCGAPRLAQALQDDKLAKRIELYSSVFGAFSRKGQTLFMDAVPETATLEIDVMTPHHAKYYAPQGAAWPADWESPTPVPFLTIGRGSVFHFAVGGAHRAQAAGWLREALDWPGAGAKTSAGYGAWKIITGAR
jgi:CRISPR-associated protein Cmr6